MGKKPKSKVKTCVRCGDEYVGHIAQKWCPNCKALKDKEEQKEVRILECPFCGEIFETVKTNKKFCCDEHKRMYHIQEYYKNKFIDLK